MYSINGRSLHEGHTGWRILREGTNTQGGITRELTKVKAPGRNGYRRAPSTFGEAIVVFTVRTPRNRLDELLALCDAAHTLTRTDDPTKMLRVELASATPSSDAPLDADFDVSVTLSAYDGVWLDTDVVVEGPITIGSPSTTHELFDGLSAPMAEPDVFIKGQFTQFTLTDSEGSFLKTTKNWPGSSSTGILWIGATQQAFLANESSPWTPVSDASQYVDINGNGGFVLTPFFVSGNPADRVAKLTLVTLAQTNVTLRVRGRRSYRMN